MGGFVVTTVFGMYPAVRRDRSLQASIGLWPGSDVDEDSMFSMWAISPWPRNPVDARDGTDQALWPIYNTVLFEEVVNWTGGGDPPYKIVGVTRDAGGTIVAGAKVDLYRTVDDVLVTSTVSDAQGNFGFSVQDTSTPYYIRAWKLAPAIQGTTVDTLVGQT